MPEREDAAEGARTYLNYLRAYEHCCRSLGIADHASLVVAQRQRRWFSRGRRAPRCPEGLQPHLFRGWLTHEFMHGVHLDEEHAPVLGAAMWLPIQAYYACHAVGLAVGCAIGSPAATTHESFARVVSENIMHCGMLPYPFSCRCCGDPDAPGSRETYIEADITADEVAGVSNLLRRPLSAEEAVLLIGKSLKTTRRRQLLRLQQRERRQTGRRRLSAAIRHSICNRLVPTTCIDLLLRMRLRANYQDPDVFLAGFVGEDAREFCHLVLWMTDVLCCQFEQVIRHKLGRDRYDSLACEFARLRDEWHTLS
jgi:hypothetical protein